jgi:hypothetical protein
MVCAMRAPADRTRATPWLHGCCAALLVVATPVTAAAHGTPPSVLSVVSADENGAVLLRLSGGLAVREGSAYRFLCPALWVDQNMLPALGASGGPNVVIGDQGLSLVADDGRVTPHPDPSARGPAIDIAALHGKLYVLRSQGAGSEVIEVGSDRVTTIWSADQAWNAIAAGDDFLLLARLHAGVLQQLLLNEHGETLAQDQATAPAAASSVIARTVGAQAYLVTAFEGGRQLAKFQDGQLVALQVGRSSIEGPVATVDGHWLIGIDSALSSFDGEQVSTLDQNAGLNCLTRWEGQSFACTREGLSRLTAAGVGERVFALSSLLAPPVDQPGEDTDLCQSQWQHYSFDLLSLGIPLSQDAATVGTSAVSKGDAGMADGGPRAAARDAAILADASTRSQASGGACSVSARRPASPRAWLVACASLVHRAWLRRRKRQAARAS